jgi:polyhydroxyalkanoate synthesis regulator phasin
MVLDALRGYVQLASGLTEVTRQKAQAAAKALLQQTGADSLTTGLTGKVSELTDEIVATSKSNRQLLQAIVSNEVEGAVARLGFVRSEEVAALTRRVQTLEGELAEARATAAPARAAAAPADEAPEDDDWSAPVPKKAAKKTTTKKAAKKTTAKKAAKKAPAAKKAAETTAAEETAAEETAAETTAEEGLT